MSSWKRLLQPVLKTASDQRLVIALLLSVMLHLFLIGKFQFNVSGVDEQPQMIEARLLMKPPAMAKPLPEHVAKKSKANPIPVNPPPADLVPNEPVLDNLAPEIQQESSPVIAESTVSDELPAPSDAVEINNKVSSELTAESQSDDASANQAVEVNSSAYKYVETTFDVRTDITADIETSPAGSATMTYELLSNGEQYQLKSLMQAKGLAALVIPDLLQTSEGFLSSTGLQPKHYLYQFGDRKNKTYSADFDWEQGKLSLHNTKGNQTVALLEGTQDLLSFMYQFMFVAPLQNMQLNITNGRKLGTYDYVLEGEEIIATKMGKISTMHIARGETNADEKTELWLALDYQYVPVKIRKTEKDGKVYELLITSLRTEKPVNK